MLIFSNTDAMRLNTWNRVSLDRYFTRLPKNANIIIPAADTMMTRAKHNSVKPLRQRIREALVPGACFIIRHRLVYTMPYVNDGVPYTIISVCSTDKIHCMLITFTDGMRLFSEHVWIDYFMGSGPYCAFVHRVGAGRQRRATLSSK